MSTTPSIQQAFCPHCGFSRQALLFFLFFFGRRKGAPPSAASFFFPSSSSTPALSPSLLIFMDLSANGLVILLRSESAVSVSPSPLCRVCLVSLNPLQNVEGGANWPLPSCFFTLLPATPPLAPQHHHLDNQSRRHVCPACAAEAAPLGVIAGAQPTGKVTEKDILVSCKSKKHKRMGYYELNILFPVKCNLLRGSNRLF